MARTVECPAAHRGQGFSFPSSSGKLSSTPDFRFWKSQSSSNFTAQPPKWVESRSRTPTPESPRLSPARPRCPATSALPPKLPDQGPEHERGPRRHATRGNPF